jgi:hypothetical protein
MEITTLPSLLVSNMRGRCLLLLHHVVEQRACVEQQLYCWRGRRPIYGWRHCRSSHQSKKCSIAVENAAKPAQP